MKRKIMVMGVLIAITLLSLAAIQPGKTAFTQFKNLQVLPDTISSRQLSKIMVDVFGDELGASCNFCHAENKDTHKMDYASDEKPEKEIARAMMRMTNGINEKYFSLKTPMVGDSVLAVSCGTCHHGVAHPENLVGQ